MSAFIVSEECMNRIVSLILTKTDAFGQMPTRAENAGQRIGCLLYQINAQAVNEKYNGGEEVPDYRFQFWPVSHVNLVQAYKSLRCLLYQCSEGSVPDMDLFHELEAFSNKIAHEIVRRLPAYEQAEWD